jgi:hypothetical protein
VSACPFCGHEWSRHDPDDGMCDSHTSELHRIGVCQCGRDLAWMQEKIAKLSRSALKSESDARVGGNPDASEKSAGLHQPHPVQEKPGTGATLRALCLLPHHPRSQASADTATADRWNGRSSSTAGSRTSTRARSARTRSARRTPKVAPPLPCLSGRRNER